MVTVFPPIYLRTFIYISPIIYQISDKKLKNNWQPEIYEPQGSYILGYTNPN